MTDSVSWVDYSVFSKQKYLFQQLQRNVSVVIKLNEVMERNKISRIQLKFEVENRSTDAYQCMMGVEDTRYKYRLVCRGRAEVHILWHRRYHLEAEKITKTHVCFLSPTLQPLTCYYQCTSKCFSVLSLSFTNT